MFPRVTPIFLVLVGALVAPTARLQAQLASKSPFMGPQAANAAGPNANAPLQFVGYMDTNEGRLYRLHDPAKKTSTWVKLNEKNTDFDVVAKQHDDEHSTLTIEYQGKKLTLAQREPKIVSSGNAGQAVPPPPVPMPVVPSNVPSAVTQAVVLNPTPADEQKRLEAVAAEVARRRALREQATQQINQGQVPQPPNPAMQQQLQRPPGNFPQNTPGSRGMVTPGVPNPNTRQR